MGNKSFKFVEITNEMVNMYIEEALNEVRKNGLRLSEIYCQTPRICLEAVRQNPDALVFVQEQTHEICMEAIKKSWFAIRHVRKQTPELCLEAVKHFSWCTRIYN